MWIFFQYETEQLFLQMPDQRSGGNSCSIQYHSELDIEKMLQDVSGLISKPQWTKIQTHNTELMQEFGLHSKQGKCNRYVFELIMF